MGRRFPVYCITFVLLLEALASFAPVQAAPAFGNASFERTWRRTDDPVASGAVHRTWMWGPQPNTAAVTESYVHAGQIDGTRLVQYFDKSRMEDNAAYASDPWDVTNGLLAEELMSGNMQFGDQVFRAFAPAQINVAGDTNDPNGPTYATFQGVAGRSPYGSGVTITATIDRGGHVGTDAALSSYTVTAVDVGSPTHHTVASPFWAFMNSSGTVSQNGSLSDAPLFLNPFYATGYPLTEAYWTPVLVGGIPQQVLVQVFERRVLTFTPANPYGWQVEAGNVGQHYYQWRYIELGNPPASPPTGSTPSPPPTASITTSARVSSPAPDQGTSDTVYGVILRNGSGLAGVPMTAIWHFPSGDQSCTGTSGGDGTGTCSVIIPAVSAAATVTIDVGFNYSGAVYAAQSSVNLAPPPPASTIQIAAWVSDASPRHNTFVTAYGQLTSNGAGVAGATMSATWYYKTTTSYCSSVTSSGADGTASCARDISTATSGYTVQIRVVMTYAGQSFEAWTSFTPQ